MRGRGVCQAVWVEERDLFVEEMVCA
jgi:hypothetical protein